MRREFRLRSFGASARHLAVALDHVFVIAAGDITRAARAWIVEQLDAGQRRHIIFMDRDEFLGQSARILLDLQTQSPLADQGLTDDDIPF